MNCPFCNAADTKVLDSRLFLEGKQIKRRRQCLICESRFTTYEIAELRYPLVIKNNQARETFSEEKLRNGIYRALQKRPVTEEMLEQMIQKILDQIRKLGEKEITSFKIGELVLQNLKNFDQVAYVRFASVYRSFNDVESFTREIQKLNKKEL